ncbi:MAG: GNAT family N-acetyltransferase [Mariniphaga sp.]|nr:GNAT family N-acetyltransferase [Mariniphaga sp.]
MKSLLNTKIETTRLLLVPIALRYKKDIFNELTREITVYMEIEPSKDLKETQEFIDKSIKGIKRGNNLQLVILEKISKEFLGCIGLHKLDKDTPEMGIWIKKSAFGYKYGQEAMKALKQWADENSEYEYITYSAAEKNIASRKIAEMLGGKIERKYNKKIKSGKEYFCYVYRIYSNKK